MYIPFKINKDEICNLINIKSNNTRHLKSMNVSAQDIIKKIDLETGILNGDEIKEGWLPIDSHYDFFISYSHKDAEEAISLVTFLEERGLSCFIDDYYWNSADDLLRAIDNKYCLNSNGLYNYTKRNYSTSLVHALLSMAITEAIDNSDFAIFIESNNSTCVDLNNISNQTLSPWIYEELNIINLITKKQPSWLQERLRLFSEGGSLNESDKLMVNFSVPTNTFVEIHSKTLNRCMGRSYEWIRSLFYNINAALD